MLVAVYGTLKRGFHNHKIIADAEYLGDDKLDGIALYLLEFFPGAKYVEGKRAFVEIFRLTEEYQLNLMDYLEGYDPHDPEGSLYKREVVKTKYGEAYIYIFNGDVDGLTQVFKFT